MFDSGAIPLAFLWYNKIVKRHINAFTKFYFYDIIVSIIKE